MMGATRAISRQLAGSVSRFFRRQLFPPFVGLVFLAPGVVELHERLDRVCQEFLRAWGDLILALLHSRVAVKQQRLRFPVLLLAKQTAPEKTRSDVPLPRVGQLLFKDCAGSAEQGLSLGVLLLLQQALTQVDHRGGNIGVARA